MPSHIERALLTITSKMQHCIERIDVIEQRLNELSDITMNAPSHGDVLEVRLHSAKLAAELARATVELRGEIGMASEQARRDARLAQPPETGEVPVVPSDLIDITEPDAATKGESANGWPATG